MTRPLVRKSSAVEFDLLELTVAAVDAWPQFDTGAPVDGADLVEWFGEWRAKVNALLNEPTLG